MKKLIKHGVTAGLALLVLVGTLLIESGSKLEAVTVFDLDVKVAAGDSGATLLANGESLELSGEQTFEVGDTVQTSNGQTALVRFDEHGVVRIAPLSALIFRTQTEEGYVFELRQGQAWVNNLSTSSHLNVLAGGALLLPRRASFDVSFDEQVTEVRAFSGQVTVGLVTDTYEPDEVLVFQSEELVNSFLVAEGSRAVISLNKIVANVDLLRQLLYSKLIKEFQYGLMDPESTANDSWVTQNFAADRELLAEISSGLIDGINNRGLKYASLDALGYELDKSIIALSDVLTFTEEKRTDRLLQNIFEQLLDAQYLLSFGRDAEAQERLGLFRQMMNKEMGSRGQLFREKAIDKLRRQYAQMHVVLPTDSIYDTKVMVSDLLIDHLNTTDENIVEKLGLIRDYMNYAYTLADDHRLEARVALEQYFNRFRAFVEREKSQLAGISNLIAEENQIMDNLLRQYPQFYQDKFFAMKDFLEEELLRLIPEGPDKNEERQTLISAKIDFLRQLQTFFLNENIVLADAEAVATRLIGEIRDLQPATAVGVSDLVKLRLQDYGTFLTFLRTTEVSQLRGASPQQAYNTFLAQQEEQLSIEQVFREFLGEEGEGIGIQPRVSVDEIVEIVEEDFEELGAESVRVSDPSSASQELISILSAELNGVSFSGEYDWQRKLISNVRSRGEVVAEDAVRLSSLVLLLGAEEEVVETTPEGEVEEEVEQPPALSQAERVATILLVQKLRTHGIVATEENIVIRDLDAGTFVINGATLEENDDVQVAFAFENKTNLVTTLAVRTPAGDLRADEQYDISNLATVSQQIYDQAVEEAEV